jgi:hypothetical protein
MGGHVEASLPFFFFMDVQEFQRALFFFILKKKENGLK